MSDAKQMAELAADVAAKGYDWKHLAKASEEKAERYLFRLHEVLTENKRLKETVERKQAAKLVLQKEVAEQRTKDAQLVRDMLEMPQWKSQAWARMALTVAARAIERGYHWTPDERLDNLFEALMEEAEKDESNAG